MADAMRVDGARQLRATMKRAGVSLDDLKAAHGDIANMVATAAASRAPRDSGKLSGTIRGAGTARASIVRAGFGSVPYAGPIHWGWPSRNIAANPFISVAAQSTETQWLGTMTRAIETIIDQIEGA